MGYGIDRVYNKFFGSGKYLTKEEQRRQAVAAAETELQVCTREQEEKYQQYKAYLGEHPITVGIDNEEAKIAQSLKVAYEDAQKKVEEARKKLWSAKYDTMSDQQLQEAAVQSTDEEESAYIAQLQNKKVTEERNRDLEIMSKVADPNSVLYDPEFARKSGYQSTMVIEGVEDALDAGLIDEDNMDRVYEFINGNEYVSELTIGKERNYYKITEEEKRIYNYWYNYDREHGTSTAQQYLDLLQETLNARDSADDYAKIEGKPILEAAYGWWAGTGKYGRNTNNWYLKSGEYIPMSSTEMTAQRAYEGLADVGFQINGKSLGQIGYSYIEDKAYNAPGDWASKLAGPDNTPAAAVIKGIFSASATGGEAYREMINRGYTNEQATTYGRVMGVGSGIASAASTVLDEKLEKAWEGVFANEGMRKLGNILSKTEWLGVTKLVEDGTQATFEPFAKFAANGDLQIVGKAAIATKVLDKIVNQARVSFSEVSPDLRQVLQELMADPEIRREMERLEIFTKAQLDVFTKEMEKVNPGKDDVGTYIGDYLYGENGYAINKHYLQPIVEQAIRERGKYINDQTAKAIFERYMPRSMWGR